MSEASITTAPISAVVSGGTVSASVTSSSVSSSTSATAAGVASVNNLTGAVTLAASGATWSSAGSTLTLTVAAGGGGASSWDDLAGKPSTFPPSSHASSHATGGADALSAADIGAAAAAHNHSADAITSGTLADARLSGNVVLSSDARLTDSRTPTAHAASHATTGSDALTLSVSQVSGLAAVATSGNATDLSGTLADARLSANVVLTTDSRLTNARTPTAHAASHAANGTDALTLSASQVSGLATVATSGSYADLTNKPTIPAATTSASDLTSGTLAEARLPDAVRNTPHPFMLMGG